MTRVFLILQLMRVFVFVSFLIALPDAVTAGSPQCPSSCICDEKSVICSNIVGSKLNAVFDALASTAALSDLDRLSIRNCSAPFGPMELLPSNMKIRVLEIKDCGIELNLMVFDPLAPTLVDLALPGNNISSVIFLKNLVNLEAINLNENKLDAVPENAFAGFSKLSQLRLNGNQICKLSANSLSELKNTVELLDLGNNCLDAVPATNLRNAKSLKKLILSNNGIREVKQVEFMNLPELRMLRLNGNRITALSQRAFLNVPKLSDLKLSDNHLTEFDASALNSFPVQILDLSRNNFTRIPQFKEFNSLKIVSFSDNQITRLDTLTFSGIPHLRLINLQNNQISIIARNSFDNLPLLKSVVLTNNSLRTIEKGVLDGMPTLQELKLNRNNIEELSNFSFSSLSELHTLDLSFNKLRKISMGTFVPLTKLFWLDLSNNNLETVEKGSFSGPVGTILLDENQLVCDQLLDWFITYVVKNNVRTFISHQAEVTCAAPEDYRGVRLKELMIKKANETLNSSIQKLGLGANDQQRNNVLSNLLPLLSGMEGGGPAGNAPLIGSLSHAVPALRNLPGWETNEQQNRNLDSAVEELAEPLVRFATGAQPVPSDVSSLIKSIPNLIVNLPGYGDVDISKLPPPVIEYVLKGGAIPGVPPETLKKLMEQVMQRLYAAAAHAQGRPIDPEVQKNIPMNNFKPEKYLPPLNELPNRFVTSVMNGEPLPYLTSDQTDVVKEYYTKGIPSDLIQNSNFSSLISPKLAQMVKLLPPNYDFSKLPPDVMQTIMKGELPEITSLPADLQQYIRENLNKIISQFNDGSEPAVSIDDLLKKLPKFDTVEFSTFSPYDIDQVDSDLVVKDSDAVQRTRIYIAIALGLVSTVTLSVLLFFCYYVRQQRSAVF